MIEKHFLESATATLEALNSEPGTVFWFDVDLVELGLFNRTYGRDKGNDFLKKLESFINELPGAGSCTRLESSHFVFDVITDKPYSEQEIVKYWKHYSKAFTHKYQKYYPEFSIRISCGICAMNSGDNICDVIDNATLARKESRNNRTYMPVVYTADLLEDLSTHHKKEVEIHKALVEGRFVYYLQPIVNLSTGRIVAAEALARGISADGSIQLPDKFLEIMENNGSIVELDFFIMRKVCRDLRERLDQGKSVICTSINLSRVHLEDPSTADNLLAIANEYGITSDLLNFELTETLPVDEFSKAKILIDKLREQGFGVSIDDYGSGYTGISIWQDLNFDVLKMDRKFLSDDDAIKMRNTVLIPNTIDIAKQMDIQVVCEGVERIDQCQSLRSWGCETAQGFYFSRPIPVEDFYKKFEESKGVFPIIL